jgi:D-alanyl-D-alanine carboxypeptidase/FG-GAP repeat/FlgD Ig-like domain
MNTRVPQFLKAVLTLLLCSTVVPTALAHLSMIRQGVESTGLREAGDRTGQEVAAGDFNGDGYDDLAIGAPDEGVDGAVGAGAVIIMWGGLRGLDPAGTGILTSSGRPGFVAGAEFGYALAAADFDGDGYDDLMIGAPGAAPSAGMNDAGMVYSYHGGPAGFTNWGYYSQAQGGGAIEVGDRFGSSLAAGNFDGDAAGTIGLAVGSPGENAAAGSVSWFTGNGVNPPGSPVGVLRQSDFGQPNTAGDQFGFSLAAGNILGNSQDDLAIGAPFQDVSTTNRGGMAYVKSGGVGGLTGATLVLSPGTFGFAQTDGRFGYALAIGKIISSLSGSHMSLAVGEPWRNISGSQKSGRVLIYKGGTAALSSSPKIVDQADAGGVVEAWDEFGWDLAADRFWNTADGWDDLAVGSPGDGFNFTSFAGSVNIMLGGSSGPGSHGWYGYSQQTLNESIEANDNLGMGLAYGQFDGTGNGHLIVGAPGEDNDAGMVHVIAPWRQTYGLSCKTSIVFDCGGVPMFSQKPYDQVYIASTTKILTVLIGCERIQSGVILPTDEYIVPAWVADQIPGSQVPLYTGEKMNFLDMLKLCLHLSGNDAAHALADWMQGSGGPSVSIPLFIEEMNTRAAQLGLSASHFNNANGFEQEVVGPDLGDHYSTAYDMAILSREAMKNPLFADIADDLTYGVIRQFPIPTSPGNFYNAPMSGATFFASLMQNSIQPAVGIKGGSTNAAQITGCFAAKNPVGAIWVAGTYGTPFAAPSGVYTTDAGNLLRIGGLSPTCGVFDFEVLFTQMNPGWFDLSALGGNTSIGAVDLTTAGSDDVAVEMGHWRGSDLQARVNLYRDSEHTIVAGNEAIFGVGPYQGHADLKITNIGNADADAVVYLSYAAAPIALSLAPNESMIIPADDPGAVLPDFEMMVMNGSPAGDTVELAVEECYPVDVTLGPGVDPLRVLLKRVSSGYMRDSFHFEVRGMTAAAKTQDAVANMYLVVQDPNSQISTDVPGPEQGFGPGTVIKLRPAHPNPFQASTEIRFELPRSARVALAIFDARGRLVRRLPEEELSPGRHQTIWNGRDGQGNSVATGVYFYRVSAEGMPSSAGKLTVVR